LGSAPYAISAGNSRVVLNERASSKLMTGWLQRSRHLRHCDVTGKMLMEHVAMTMGVNCAEPAPQRRFSAGLHLDAAGHHCQPR
jgi:hypothetical protein